MVVVRYSKMREVLGATFCGNYILDAVHTSMAIYVTATELNKKFEQVHYVLDWFG